MLKKLWEISFPGVNEENHTVIDEFAWVTTKLAAGPSKIIEMFQYCPGVANPLKSKN